MGKLQIKTTTKKMNIIILWTNYSGYSLALWREISSCSTVDLSVIAYSETRARNTAFELLGSESTKITLIERSKESFEEKFGVALENGVPDIVVLPGWNDALYRGTRDHPKLSKTKFFLTLDHGKNRRLLGKLRMLFLRKFLRRIDFVLAAGKTSASFAYKLGFRNDQVFCPLYCYDDRIFFEKSSPTRWSSPSGFVFVGRLVEDKGIKILLSAYSEYRESTLNPWPLTLVGSGPLENLARSCPGIVLAGFLKPAASSEMLTSATTFVFPSLYEPWGVALAEACACGLPVICSTSVGSNPELVKDGENGMLVAPTVKGLKDAMSQMSRLDTESLQRMSKASVSIAEKYSATNVANQWLSIFRNAV